MGSSIEEEESGRNILLQMNHKNLEHEVRVAELLQLATDTGNWQLPLAPTLLPVGHPDILDLHGVAQVLPALSLVIVEPITAFAVVDPCGFEIAG
jgi:hypothetical protein